MKKQTLAIILFSGASLFNLSIAQKKKVNSATLAFKNTYNSNMLKKNYDGAKTAILNAKGYIDEAAENEDTANEAKMYWMKGTIYSNIYALGKLTNDSSLLKNSNELIETAAESFKKCYDIGSKYHYDIKSSVRDFKSLLNPVADQAIKNEDFNSTAEIFNANFLFNQSMGITDSVSLYYTAYSLDHLNKFNEAAQKYTELAQIGYRPVDNYILANIAYRNNKDLEKAKAIISEGRQKYPDSKDLLLQAADTYISANDPAGAETLLNEAISKDPKNKVLHLNIGLVYMDLGKKEKAEEAMLNAIAIDPVYEDGLYQLGAHLVNWARDISNEVSDLPFNDPKAKGLEEKATEIFKRSTIHLEKYIELVPKDKDVLNILAQIYTYLGNAEKANEYRTKAQ